MTRPSRRAPRRRPPRFALALLAASSATIGCASLSSNTALINDSSHLGTPYSGVRSDLHLFHCFGRSLSRSASALIWTPIMVFPLVDGVASLAVDTILLPFDIALEPDVPPKPIRERSCDLIGM